MIHYLKTEPIYFQAVLDGLKKAEIRVNDREYHVGDVLVLQEWERQYSPQFFDEETGKEYGTAYEDHYSGRACRRIITHILTDPDARWLKPGVVVLSLQPEDEEIPPSEHPEDTLHESAQTDPFLHNLVQETNNALAHAKRHVKGAINWSSCRCLDARQWTDVSARTGYQVIIDEVDPDTTELQVFIQGWLEAIGFLQVEVVTAW